MRLASFDRDFPLVDEIAQLKTRDRARSARERWISRKRLMAELRPRAEAGDPAARFDLYRSYLDTALAGPKDGTSATEALRWLRACLDQGYSRALADRIRLRQDGALGFEYDANRIAEDCQTLAFRRIGYFMYRLGECHLYGHGVVQDDALARRWLFLALDRRVRQAYAKLGECYAEGRLGLGPDLVMACAWLDFSCLPPTQPTMLQTPKFFDFAKARAVCRAVESTLDPSRVAKLDEKRSRMREADHYLGCYHYY